MKPPLPINHPINYTPRFDSELFSCLGQLFYSKTEYDPSWMRNLSPPDRSFTPGSLLLKNLKLKFKQSDSFFREKISIFITHSISFLSKSFCISDIESLKLVMFSNSLAEILQLLNILISSKVRIESINLKIGGSVTERKNIGILCYQIVNYCLWK